MIASTIQFGNYLANTNGGTTTKNWIHLIVSMCIFYKILFWIFWIHSRVYMLNTIGHWIYRVRLQLQQACSELPALLKYTSRFVKLAEGLVVKSRQFHCALSRSESSQRSHLSGSHLLLAAIVCLLLVIVRLTWRPSNKAKFN